MLKILLTGGGTAGHVIPNIALIQYLKANQAASMLYIGSKNNVEKQWVEQENIPYIAITTGKLRRHFSLKNLFVPFQLTVGIFQSWKICRAFKPTIVFSKGGFVALPVVIAAWLLRIPIIVHESDVIPGLANRLSFPLAHLICFGFNINYCKYSHKVAYTGLPIRSELMQGDARQGRDFLEFNEKKPILLVWGGSLGAVTLNNLIRHILPSLLITFQVIHLCGPGKVQKILPSIQDYRVFEVLNLPELSHVLACADLVISRAGATAIYELIMLHKPNILFPLSKQASRGEQICNAKYLESLGLSKVIYPDAFNADIVLKKISACYQGIEQFKRHIESFNLQNGVEAVYEKICLLSKQ